MAAAACQPGAALARPTSVIFHATLGPLRLAPAGERWSRRARPPWRVLVVNRPGEGSGPGVGGDAGGHAGPDDADRAVAELYAAHWRRLVRLAVLLVRDLATAEEVVQDAFIATARRWERLRDHDRAAAYLRQSVVNRARSELRHRGVVERHAEAEATRPLRAAPGADVQALATERRTAVLDALRELPDRQREVLALRHYLELSEAEIADALGISRGAVKTHASRGSARLRELLAPYLDGERR